MSTVVNYCVPSFHIIFVSSHYSGKFFVSKTWNFLFPFYWILTATHPEASRTIIEQNKQTQFHNSTSSWFSYFNISDLLTFSDPSFRLLICQTRWLFYGTPEKGIILNDNQCWSAEMNYLNHKIVTWSCSPTIVLPTFTFLISLMPWYFVSIHFPECPNYCHHSSEVSLTSPVLSLCPLSNVPIVPSSPYKTCGTSALLAAAAAAANPWCTWS